MKAMPPISNRYRDWDGKAILIDSLNNIYDWLIDNGVPFDEIWHGPGKPFANEYWDDRAVCFEPTYEGHK